MGGASVLRRAQRLWELAGDSSDQILWRAVLRAFERAPGWRRGKEGFPSLDFIETVWREAGKRNPEFGTKLAEAYTLEGRDSVAADVLLEVIKTSEPTAVIASQCITLLDVSKRIAEADSLVQRLRPKLATEPAFVEAWARHALRSDDKDALKPLVQTPTKDQLWTIRPSIAAQVFLRTGLAMEAHAAADKMLLELRASRAQTPMDLEDAAEAFRELGRWPEFEKSLEARHSPDFYEGLLRRLEAIRRPQGKRT